MLALAGRVGCVRDRLVRLPAPQRHETATFGPVTADTSTPPPATSAGEHLMARHTPRQNGASSGEVQGVVCRSGTSVPCVASSRSLIPHNGMAHERTWQVIVRARPPSSASASRGEDAFGSRWAGRACWLPLMDCRIAITGPCSQPLARASWRWNGGPHRSRQRSHLSGRAAARANKRMQLTKRGGLVGVARFARQSSLSRALQLIRGVRRTLEP